MYDRLMARSLKTRLKHPDPLRHRRRSRPQQRRRGHDLPAQRRPRRDPERQAGRGGAPPDGARSARHRHPVDVRALRDGAAGHPLGPRLRGLQRGSGAGRRARRRRGPRPAGYEPRRSAADPGLRQALRRRRRHGVGHRASGGQRPAPSARSGRRHARRARLQAHPHAGLHQRPEAGRRHDHAVLQLVEGREGLGERAPADRHSQEGDGLRGLRDLRLQRPRRHSRRLPQRHQDVDQRRHGHGDGAVEVQGVLPAPQEPRRVGRGADGAHRRRRPPHPAREVRDGADGSEAQPARGPQAAGERRLGRAPRGGAAGRARVAGAAEERQEAAADRGDGQAHPRRRRRRQRHRHPGRRLDDHVAGPGGPGHQGHDHPRRAQGGGEERHERHLRR